MKTIAIYARVSTDDQNIEQQLALLKDHCKTKQWKYRSFIDAGVSGKIDDRPAWLQLIKACEKGEFKGILVSKWDRITRNLAYAIKFLDWLEPIYESDFKLYSLYDGEFDFIPNDKFIFKMKCLLSEYELDVFKWRSRIGIERAKKEGKYKGGKKGRTWKCQK